MKIHSVFDPAFKRYGQVVEGLPDTVSELLEALQKTPLPEGTGYVPEEPLLQELPAAVEMTTAFFVNIIALGLWDIQYVKVRSINAFIGAEVLMQ